MLETECTGDCGHASEFRQGRPTFKKDERGPGMRWHERGEEKWRHSYCRRRCRTKRGSLFGGFKPCFFGGCTLPSWQLLGVPALYPPLFRFLARTGRFHAVHDDLPPPPIAEQKTRKEIIAMLNSMKVPQEWIDRDDAARKAARAARNARHPP
ncbi:hypothetical protein C8R44DRAFT_746396 [Mycena epipterygia]|nr:hypothetical protein C8R44DRAFT_746396 [Mycena epipterygia]